MPLCRDPLVAQLNSLGFNAVRVPRADYRPSSLLVSQRRHPPALFGSLSDAFANVSTPAVIVGAAGQFSAAATAKYRKELGLKIAGDWLTSAAASLHAAFQSARRVSFRFGDMRVLSVPLATLGSVIAEADPTPALVNLVDARLNVIIFPDPYNCPPAPRGRTLNVSTLCCYHVRLRLCRRLMADTTLLVAQHRSHSVEDRLIRLAGGQSASTPVVLDRSGGARLPAGNIREHFEQQFRVRLDAELAMQLLHVHVNRAPADPQVVSNLLFTVTA